MVFLPGMMCDMRHFGFQIMDIADDRSVTAINIARQIQFQKLQNLFWTKHQVDLL